MLDGHVLGLIDLEKYASEKHQLLTKFILTHLVVRATGLSHAEQEMERKWHYTTRKGQINEIILTSSDNNIANYTGVLSGSNALLDAHDGHCCFVIWMLHLEHNFTKLLIISNWTLFNWLTSLSMWPQIRNCIHYCSLKNNSTLSRHVMLLLTLLHMLWLPLAFCLTWSLCSHLGLFCCLALCSHTNLAFNRLSWCSRVSSLDYVHAYVII